MWPDNWRAWQLFCQLGGQWRTGLGGAFALDYTPLLMLLDRMRLDDATWQALFDDVRVLEGAALTAMRNRKKA